MKRNRRLLIVAGTNRYGLRVLSGIHAYCQEHGKWEYHVEDYTHRQVLERVRFAIRGWKAEGVIFLADAIGVDRVVVQSGLPAVNFSGYSVSELPTALPDNVAAGRLVAQHLLNNGCRNFGFCSQTEELSPRLRCEGFVKELRRNGYACSVFVDRLVGGVEKNWVQNRKRMDQWLRDLPKPVGIMCSHDRRAQEVSWACRRAGLPVPDQVALVSVGDDEVICQMCTPPMSSVATDGHRVGYEAARLLERMMRGGKRPSRPVLVPPRGISVRASSDIIGISDVEIASAMRFIRDNGHRPIGVKDLLQEVAISRRAMERRFEKAIGRTPKEEIMRIRIQRAKELLSETNLSAAAIALRSGFSRPDKLSTAFRQHTGQTPSAYRRKHQRDDLKP